MILRIKHDNSYTCRRVQYVNTRKQGCYFLLLFVPLVSLILLSSQVRASTNSVNPSLDFFDNGTLTLDAEGVPLGTLLREIQEKTNLEFRIHDNLLVQPVYVRFQSLPLDEAIKRILYGVSHACIFDANGNVRKIITLSNSGTAKDSYFVKGTLDRDLSYKVFEEIMSPSRMENMAEAMGIEPPPEVENIEEVMEIELPPEGEDIDQAMGIEPPPDAENIEEVMEIDPPPESEDTEGAIRNMPSPQAQDIEEAIRIMRIPKVEDSVKAVGMVPPPEAKNP